MGQVLKIAAKDFIARPRPTAEVVRVLIDAKETQQAAFLWTYLGYPKPEGVTHPDFETPRLGAGFDWRLEHPAGVTHIPLDSPAAVRVRLSGLEATVFDLSTESVTGLRSETRLIDIG